MAEKQPTEQQPEQQHGPAPADQMGTEEANRRFDQIAAEEYQREFNDMAASGSMGQPQDPAMQEKMIELAQQKAMELEKIASEQVMNANPEQPITMTELLAGEGAFAEKAKELGLDAEWQQFTGAQQEIGKLREELMGVEEQRAADANRVAGITPALEEEAGKVRKTSMVSGVLGAAAGGVGGAYVASKRNQGNPMRALLGGAGALLGGAIAAIVGARSGAKKAMNKVEQQVGEIGNLQPNEEFEKKSAELQEKLGQAQQESISGITGVMVERMVEQQIMADQQAAQQQLQEAVEKEAGHLGTAPQEGKPGEEQGAPQVEPQQQPTGEVKPAEQGQAAVDKEFERHMTAEGMGPSQQPQHTPQSGPAPQTHPQTPHQPQQSGGAPTAPLEQALAQRALAAQPQGGSKADAVLREREQQSAERQV